MILWLLLRYGQQEIDPNGGSKPLLHDQVFSSFFFAILLDLRVKNVTFCHKTTRWQ